jgi:uncharacterized membrane protein YqjE
VSSSEPTSSTAQEPSLGALAKEASTHMSTLVRAEIELAKAEVSVQAKRAGMSVALFAIAGVLVVFALIFGFIALAEGLTALGISRWLSYLIVFAFLLLVAGFAAYIGIRKIKKLGPPERTIATMRDNAELAKHLKPADS